MTERLIIAGVGGQGIQALGKMIAAAALRENKNVTWLPSYGAEMRGGPSNCHVIISDEAIGSPFVDKADALLMMSEVGFEHFETFIKPDGVLVFNSSMIRLDKSKRHDIDIYHIDATDIAGELGDKRMANMVLFGGYLAVHPVLQEVTVEEEVRTIFKNKQTGLIEKNCEAMKVGKESLR